MARNKFSLPELLDYLVSYIHAHGSPTGMKQAAAAHFDCDRRTITRALDELRRQKRLGRDAYRKWRNSTDAAD